MASSPFSAWCTAFAPRFEQHFPRRLGLDWLLRFVDEPRFGWDLATLDTGFTAPLYRFIDAQPLPAPGAPVAANSRFLRSAWCCALMQALAGGSSVQPLQFDLELTALELHAAAATLLDGLDNGRNLAASRGRETELALPVLITAAYSARQLAASMLWSHSALPAARRDALCQRFARLLMLQGIGHTMDLWGAEAALGHHGAAGLAAHLQWVQAPLDFELPCELAAAACGLDEAATAALVRAGGALGVAWHAALAARDAPGMPPLRWQALAEAGPGDTQAALAEVAERARREALQGLAAVSPAAAALGTQFLAETAAFAPAALELA